MCQIVFDRRHGSTERIDRAIMERSFEKNPDGIGLMYPWDGELKVWKSLDDFDTMWDRYTTVRDAGGIIAVHFRATSVGDTNEDNLHPFFWRDGEDYAFMHNGTMKGLERIAKKMDDGISDTKLFQKNIFHNLPRNWIEIDGLYHMVSNYIGRSRLLFMDGTGRWYIMNDHIGYWWPDDWHGKHAKRHVWFSQKKHKYYIMEGKTYNYTKGATSAKKTSSGKATSRENTKKSSSTSSGSDDSFPASEDSWYRRRAQQVQTSEEFSDEAREVDMIFEYGDKQRHIDGARYGLEYVGEAWMPGAQLWAMEDPETELVIPGLVDSDEYGDIAIGSVYRLDPDAGVTKEQLLDYYDQVEGDFGDPADSYFCRMRSPVYLTTKAGTNIIYPWTYFCNVSFHTAYQRVEHGDWSMYLEESEDSKHDDRDPKPSDQRLIEDPYVDLIDSPECPRCGRRNTLAVEGYVEQHGYVENHVFCRDCQREFDADGNTFIRPVV